MKVIFRLMKRKNFSTRIMKENPKADIEDRTEEADKVAVRIDKNFVGESI